MNKETKQLKILIDAKLASAFKEACKQSGVSMAKDLATYIGRRVGAQEKTAPQARVFQTATRKGRRVAVRSIVLALAAIRDAEQAYAARTPENLKNAPAYEAAEYALDMLDEAIAILDEAFR